MGMLDGKVFIITGGANGIGRATALVCAREGAKVVVADRDIEGGELTTKLVEDAGGDALFVSTDVTNRADVADMVACALARYERLDGAFNNAGIEGQQGPIDECTDQNWAHVIETNLTSVFRCMHAELDALSEGASIVNCASVAGLVGFNGIPAYVASKHGIVGLTKAAALDLATRNIRVNAVCPGVIDTDMIDRFTGGDPGARSGMAAMAPMNRMGTPEEIGELVAWLFSDHASFVTGQAIAADGGFVTR
jgi:NAD(P)-dependent dehydrogenase (short-subunit alcohol dehydrogenase family)